MLDHKKVSVFCIYSHKDKNKSFAVKNVGTEHKSKISF